MQEFVSLRKHQQTIDHHLQTLSQRLQGMEQRQQQMISFLAKAMQSPEFLAQFVQQNDSSRRIVGVSKKQRLPKQESNLPGGQNTSPDCQIIKYQPLITEAAKAMLLQILNMDTSSRLDHMTSSDGFLLENTPSPSPTSVSGGSSGLRSGVTLAKVPLATGMVVPTELPNISLLLAEPEVTTPVQIAETVHEYPSPSAMVPENSWQYIRTKFCLSRDTEWAYRSSFCGSSFGVCTTP